MKLTNSFELQTGTLEELNSIITQPNFKGTIANLPAWMYHQCAGVSRSTLKDLDKSLSHYLERKKFPRKPTKAMNFGSAFHDKVSSPEEFERNFVVDPIKEEGTLETVEHLKAHLAKFVDASKLKEELEGLEHVLKTHDESCAIPCPAEEELSALKPEDFATKKELAAKQKEFKDQIKEYQSACKNKASEIKLEIKSVKEKISALESKMNGNKSKLIASIREYDKEVKIWDEIINAHEAKSQGKASITQEEYSRINAMVKNVKSHPTIQSLTMHKVIYEQTFFWRDPETGLLCKCRPDVIFITPNLFLVGDWKTTECAALENFQREIGKWSYHIQAPYYLDGINIVLGLGLEHFIFIAVESEAPHELQTFAIDQAAMDIGRSRYKKHLVTLATYEESSIKGQPIWTGYPKEIQNISVPSYLFYQEA